MPTYQYACTACQHRLEVVQSFTDEALTTCPECAGRLRKLYSAVGIVFKGSGFYRTDSRPSEATGDKAETTSADKGSAEKSGSDKSGSDKTSAGATSEKAPTSAKPAEKAESSKSSTAATASTAA